MANRSSLKLLHALTAFKEQIINDANPFLVLLVDCNGKDFHHLNLRATTTGETTSCPPVNDGGGVPPVIIIDETGATKTVVQYFQEKYYVQLPFPAIQACSDAKSTYLLTETMRHNKYNKDHLVNRDFEMHVTAHLH
uniref:Uncharacterized protein n=1 Tax=Tanacetum cinerariifolium TaxID=118510 RepID=A0A6L2JH97_TANCI|nr:hypothetical protein [Tanacetum cinerariifolium]